MELKYVIVSKDKRKFVVDRDYMTDDISKAYMFSNYLGADRYRKVWMDNPDQFFVTSVEIHYEIREVCV